MVIFNIYSDEYVEYTFGADGQHDNSDSNWGAFATEIPKSISGTIIFGAKTVNFYR